MKLTITELPLPALVSLAVVLLSLMSNMLGLTEQTTNSSSKKEKKYSFREKEKDRDCMGWVGMEQAYIAIEL